MPSDTLSTARRTLPSGYVIPTDSVFSSERPFLGGGMSSAGAVARTEAASDLTRRLLGFGPDELIALQRGNVSLGRGSLGNEFGRYNEAGDWVPFARYERAG